VALSAARSGAESSVSWHWVPQEGRASGEELAQAFLALPQDEAPQTFLPLSNEEACSIHSYTNKFKNAWHIVYSELAAREKKAEKKQRKKEGGGEGGARFGGPVLGEQVPVAPRGQPYFPGRLRGARGAARTGAGAGERAPAAAGSVRPPRGEGGVGPLAGPLGGPPTAAAPMGSGCEGCEERS
jgi:hypothetical protein